MTHQEMWNKFCKENNIEKDTPYTYWNFGDTPDELAELTLRGIKKSSSTAHELYSIENRKLPEENDYSVVLNSKSEAVCIIRNIKVSLIPFNKIGEKEAIDEGDGTYENWENIHRRYFAERLKQYGLKFSEDMILVYEEFELVYK